jgi:hypothetical protein
MQFNKSDSSVVDDKAPKKPIKSLNLTKIPIEEWEIVGAGIACRDALAMAVLTDLCFGSDRLDGS